MWIRLGRKIHGRCFVPVFQFLLFVFSLFRTSDSVSFAVIDFSYISFLAICFLSWCMERFSMIENKLKSQSSGGDMERKAFQSRN